MVRHPRRYGADSSCAYRYTGNESVYTYTFEHEKRPDCPVCGGESRDVDVQPEWPLERILEYLLETQDLCVSRLVLVVVPTIESAPSWPPTQAIEETVLVRAKRPALLPGASTARRGHATKPADIVGRIAFSQ